MDAMQGHDIVVIGASAGGVEATMSVVSRLPRGLDAAIFVVIHILPYAPSRLPDVLSRVSSFNCQHARDGEPIQRGHVYVAPPDQHVLVQRGYMQVVRGPKENRSRPAIDPLFSDGGARLWTKSGRLSAFRGAQRWDRGVARDQEARRSRHRAGSSGRRDFDDA